MNAQTLTEMAKVLDLYDQESRENAARLEELVKTPMTLENSPDLLRRTYDARDALITTWVKTRLFIKEMGDCVQSERFDKLTATCNAEILRLTQGHPEETAFWATAVGAR